MHCHHLATAIRIAIASLIALTIGGCSAASRGHYGTFGVSGIVVSYPADLTRAVTLSDLTPAGAGLPITIFEQAGLDADTSEYYRSHSLLVTDSNGRFTIRVDDQIPSLGGFTGGLYAQITVSSRCATTAIADVPGNGDVDGSASSDNGEIQGVASPSTPDHAPDDQLAIAGLLAQGHFNADIVIVVSDNPDNCGNQIVTHS